MFRATEVKRLRRCFSGADQGWYSDSGSRYFDHGSKWSKSTNPSGRSTKQFALASQAPSPCNARDHLVPAFSRLRHTRHLRLHPVDTFYPGSVPSPCQTARPCGLPSAIVVLVWRRPVPKSFLVEFCLLLSMRLCHSRRYPYCYCLCPSPRNLSSRRQGCLPIRRRTHPPRGTTSD